MGQPLDFFELTIDILLRIFGWAAPEKYFTFELDIMVGTIIKIISFIISLFILDIFYWRVFIMYTGLWVLQWYFIKMENKFIFQGYSNTKARQCYQKCISMCQSLYGGAIYLVTNEEEYNDPSLIVYILSFLIILDLLELFYIGICIKDIEPYESIGSSAYFSKSHLLGAIIGTILTLIFYIKFLNHLTQIYRYLIPLLISSEILFITFNIFQLCKNRKKEMKVIEGHTKYRIKMKKWYCIIIGFISGLVEVIISLTILCYCIVSFLYSYCCNSWEEVINNFQDQTFSHQIIDYEIIDLDAYVINKIKKTNEEHF